MNAKKAIEELKKSLAKAGVSKKKIDDMYKSAEKQAKKDIKDIKKQFKK